MKTKTASAKHAGFTLIEMILALAIAVSIIVFGMRLYLQYRFDLSTQQLQYNVSAIFQAMSSYYQGVCNGQLKSVMTGSDVTTWKYTYQNSKIHSGNDESVLIDLKNDLIENNYLTSNLYIIPFVYNHTKSPEDGYVIQFNRITSDRYTCTSTNTDLSSCKEKVKIGRTVIWQLQVAVKLSDDALNAASAYMGATNAKCLSSSTGDFVTPCPTEGIGEGNYLVFVQNSTSQVGPTSSGTWPTLSNVDQFTRMYNAYPASYLMSTKGEVMPDATSESTSIQDYLCGQ